MQFRLFSIPATGDVEGEAALNGSRFRNKLRRYDENYQTGRWTEQETARHVESLLAYVRRAGTWQYRRRTMEDMGLCPKQARTA